MMGLFDVVRYDAVIGAAKQGQLDREASASFESIDTAVETGTLWGKSTERMAMRFGRVVTIELSQSLFNRAKARMENEGIINVECLQGNSARVLNQILPTFSKPTFFYLDAHWSGDSTVDWKNSRWGGYGVDTAHLGQAGAVPSGPEQVPLLDEVRSIVTLCKPAALICIDDVHTFDETGCGRRGSAFIGEDWSHISLKDIFETVEPRLLCKFEERDPHQLFMFLDEKR